MERIRKRKGSVIMQRYFRKLQKDHAQILKELNYYKGENE
jgi:hypothetical protein